MSSQPGTSKAIGPLLLIAGGALVLLAAAAALWPRLAGTPASDIPFPEVARVSLEDARAAHAAGTAVMVDVRDPASYAAAHIPGALSLPLASVEERLGELDPQAWIITYCT